MELELGFGSDDGVEGVAGKGEVDVGVAFGAIEIVGGDQDGGIASADEAIVEEEAECAGRGGLSGDLLVHDDVGDDLLHLRAGFGVEVFGELVEEVVAVSSGVGRGGEGEDREEDKVKHGLKVMAKRKMG